MIQRPLRNAALPALAIAALIALVVPFASAPAGVTDPVRPDLVSDPPNGALLQNYDFGGGNTHLLLRFNGYVHNKGQGAFEIQASQRSGTHMTNVVQRLYLPDGTTYVDDASKNPQVYYEGEDGHNHWHLKNASRYSLWNESKSSEVAPAEKVGFCLEDSEHIESHGPADRVYTATTTAFCKSYEPQASSVYQGVSAAWRDLYWKTLPFQWVDVSDVRPGVYYLRSQIDPDDVVIESSESNNGGGFASSSSTIPGYVAKPVIESSSPVNEPVTVTLDATKFGNPGSRRFRIESAPVHGTLDRSVGETFTGPSLTYTPSPWYRGADSFTFSALDSASDYPLHPVKATVSLSVDGAGPSVGISGAPASLTAGTSAQLEATVVGDEPAVTWSVDGAAGGSALAGTISPSGLYTAPAIVPLSGSSTIRATSGLGAYAEATIQIAPAPIAQPAPVPAGGIGPQQGKSKGAKSKRLLTRPRIARFGKLLVVSLRPLRSGVVRVTALTGKRRIGACRARTPRGRAFACRVKLRPGVHLRDVRVVSSLRVHGKLVYVVRTSAAAKHSAADHHHHHH